MSVSGRLSSCSVVQDDYMARRMCKTPGTPIKAGYQVTPRKSESKRSLFQTNSPTNSDDLGLMSVLSPSSCSSVNSFDSPQFSPNGKFSTPPKTPKSGQQAVRSSPRISAKKIEVKSSLFPDLKLHTPKSKRGSRTPRTLISKVLTPQSNIDSCDSNQERIMSTPSTSTRKRRRQLFEDDRIVAETDSSPSVGCSTQEIEEEKEASTSMEEPTKLGIKPISSESFYGIVPDPPKAKTRLFIDTLEPRHRVRSLSRESLSSNRSFVSGGSRKKTQSNRSRSKSSTGDRRKAPHVGVWHNIKKPKHIKKIAEKPLISPKTRLAKMLSPNKEIKVKSKPLFQDYPRRRIAHSKKRSRNVMEDSGITDSFPDHLIKRKKLPSTRSDVHPAINDSTASISEPTPDQNKKFVKYKQTRNATFTLNENVKLKISDGVMKLQTPKKRRKLYSGKKDYNEDFNDFEDGDNEIVKNIEVILNRLQTDKDVNTFKNVEVENVYDAPIFHLSENEKEKQLTKSLSKSQRSPLKVVSNLPTLILNDFDSDDNEENYEPTPMNASDQEKNKNEISLAKTGNMVSYLTNILVNKDIETSPSKMNVGGEETENSPPNEGKFYSLFYKQNWKKSAISNEGTSNQTQSNKKKTLVSDDQYLLDAGQKSIGIITCKKCGVMYQSGDFADEATHNRFHNHLPELRFTNWNNERVVGKYADGRVIMILSSDPKIWWQKVLKIVDIVDQELGFPEASVKSLYHKTVYFYINEKTKQIAGCLIAEECKRAYRMFPPLEGVEIDSCSKDPSPCRIGISRIWTSLSHRRKGVASRMIDCLQRTFFFGEIVSLDQIAFSMPSPSGKLLAQKVTGRLDFLVYGFV